MKSHQNKPIRSRYTWIQKIVATIALISVLLSGPSPLFAMLPTGIIQNYPGLRQAIIDDIKEGFKTAASVGVKNGARAFLEKIAYDSAVALTSGCEYQGPCINYKEFNVAINDAGDAAVGEFLNTIATQNGFVSLNLCDLPEHEQLELVLLLPQVTGQSPYQPDCTLSDIRKELGDYGNDIQVLAATLLEDPQALTTLSIGTLEGENALSSLLLLIDEESHAQNEAEQQEAVQNIKSDFKSIEAPISGYIKTPAAVLEYQTQATYNQAVEAELTMTGNPFADALSIFTHTLAKRLLDQTASGLLSFYTEADITDSVVAGGAGGTSSSTGGSAQAARERFANLQTPSFTTGGELDVLNDFTNCPEVGVSSTNCVIGQDFRRAIEEKMTLAQATDQVNGPLISPNTPFLINPDGTPIEDYTSGINKRSIAILQYHGVIPATWMIAAEYNEEYDGTALTLGQLMDSFDDPTSPYFGLVDPDWVLKAPEVFCKVEGYGNTLVLDEYIDTDGANSTPQEHVISRLNSCVDEQTCLSEDSSGNCEAYGYCTAYEDTYRFAGEECPAYYASCQQFENSDGDDFSVLTNTINQGDCSESTVECQWMCTIYNDVDQAFQCATQDRIFQTCEVDAGCSCASASGGTCTIENGGFYCTTDDEEECTLGTVSEDSVSVDAAITFDDDVATCSENDAGCSEFIGVKGGANLVFNYSFESFNENVLPSQVDQEDLPSATDTSAAFDDTFGFYGADGDGTDASLAGQPCSEVTESGACTGWELGDGASARAVNGGLDGVSAMQLAQGSGYTQFRFDTTQALASRTFTLNFSYMNPTSSACTGQYWVAPDGERASYLTDIDFGTNTGTFATEFADSVTFPANVTETTLSVGFVQPTGCDVVLDAVTLVEDIASPGIRDYGNSEDLTYINLNDANVCSPDEVGCTTFIPETGESDFEINGQITNPLSEECGDGEDFTNPACSQCIEEFVGCDAYIEVPTPYSAPINDINNFSSPPSDELAAAIAQRTGFYCDGTTTACNTDSDCDSGVACLPSVSIVPEEAESCSADAVGCEEYVNLDVVAQGGEGNEYYTFIQQCVSETQAQINDGEIDFYYTFEGTESGYQLRSHYLKVSDDGSGAPCTNLDHYDYTGTAETAEADCVDSILGAEACDPTENPDCVEYYDSEANTYYRLRSEVIEVSDSCVSARNTLDDRVYTILPGASTQCDSSENLCREYQGSEGGSARTIIEEEFETSVWEGGASSAESLSTDTGLSMLVTNAAPATVDVSDALQSNKSYVVQFWAKGDGGTIQAAFTSGANEIPFSTTATTVSNDWQVYTLGPVVFENGLEGNETFSIEYSGAELFIDNVVLSESDSYYLLSNTLVTCNGYEGCEEYSDLEDETHYLKSFASLCEDDAVGCQALIDTSGDADNPFYVNHNGDNEFTEDDVPVGPHSVVTYTVTEESLCNQEDAGCMTVGEPSLDAYENITSSNEFEAHSVINDPDTYDTALCQEQQRWCDAWTEEDGESITYAKNFGERYCEYDASTGEWVTTEGNPCPLQNENTSPSQPKGSICNGGERVGELCTADSNCPAEEGDSSTYRCVTYQSDASGWAGLCADNYAQCTLYLDPNGDTEVVNDSFELDQFDNSDYSIVAGDDNPDYWEVLNEGESATSGGGSASPNATTPAYQSSDIVGGVLSAATDSRIAIWHGNDSPFIAVNGTSGSFVTGNTTFTDTNGGNPSSLQPTLVGVRRLGWNGISSDTNVTLVTNNTNAQAISFTFPALARSALQDNVLLFYISTDGNLYWADSGHDGVKADGSDFLSAANAIRAPHLASRYVGSTGAIEVNGLYDALGINSTMNCSQFENSTGGFIGEHVLEIGAQSDACMVGTKSLIPVNTNKTYTLSAKIKASSADSTFALGLLYYDATGEEINVGTDPQDYAIAAFEGTGRDDSESVQPNTWVHYHGEVGPNLAASFPENTYYVRVFTEAGSSNRVQFDDVNFSPNQEYTYIENTVDTSSCNGLIDIANGCVPFRNTNNDSLTTLSASPELTEAAVNFTTQSCTFDSVVETLGCQARAFSADTNEVILVEQDRECSEWLGCTDGEPIYNEAGELERVVCYDVGLCQERNPETGGCTVWAPNKNGSDLTESDVISTNLSATNPLALNDIQKMSGYSTIGASWDTGVCTNGECSAGNLGATCSTDSDCNPSFSGYYPYNWMPYIGLGGSTTNIPIISNGDFEDVFCNGENDGTYSDYDASGVERARDEELTCTQDVHCRTIETDAALEGYLARIESTTQDNIEYESGWCSNVDNNAWSGNGNNWTAIDADINIIDYNPGESQRIYDANLGVTFNPFVEGVGAGVAAADLDLDNYLYVSPTSGTASYVRVELRPESIIDGQEYTVQFNGGHIDSPQSGDNLEIFLEHGSSAERDYFVQATDQEQLEQGVQSYTFGPITANKSNSTDISYLYIGLPSTNQGSAFVIDDVQIAATLAVNTEEIIGRECRAFPEEDSLECTYTDNQNDTIHQGWQGFCTVRDPFDSSKCITWFPVDSIPGEPNFSVQDLLFWNGHFPVYYCLAAKGNEKLGACTGGGQMCLDTSDCPGNQECLGGNSGGIARIPIRTTPNGTGTLFADVDSDNYQTTITIPRLLVDRGSHVGNSGGASDEAATFLRIDSDAMDIFKNVHISEIDNISFNLGDPVFTANSSLQPDDVWTVGGVVNFNLSEMEVEESDTSTRQDGTPVADGYNMFESNQEGDPNAQVTNTANGLFYAYQRGVVCDKTQSDELGLCQSAADIQSNVENLGMYFVKGITGLPGANDNTPESEVLTHAGGVFNNNDGDPLNPFAEGEALAPDSPIWNDGGVQAFTIDAGNATNNAAIDGIQFDGDYFFSRYYDGAYSCGTAGRGCGANIMGFYVDVQNGYIDAIYLMYWDGFHRVDTQRIDDITITLDLREVCLAATEVIDEDAQGTPWWQRAAGGSDYTIKDLGYYYAMEGVQSLYGRMDDNPAEDGLQEDFDEGRHSYANLTVSGENNFPFVFHDEAFMKPLACIGSCGDLVCENDRSAEFGVDSCENDRWIGAGGICEDSGDICNNDADCSGRVGSCVRPLLTGDGVGAQNTDYYEQLNAAVDAGWGRLRLLFADLSPDRTLWFVGENDDTSSGWYQGLLHEITGSETIESFCAGGNCDAFATNGRFDFDAMPECRVNDREPEAYCGVRPRINGLRLNNRESGNIELSSGQSVNIDFVTNTNNEQEPVQSVSIDWESNPQGDFNQSGDVVPFTRETADGEVSYTHVYTCDPTQGDTVISGGPYGGIYCLYRARIQIKDSWDFCSGENDTRSTRGECTSYDEYNGDIVVRP